MRKLLSANISRLWKSKVFWVLESFCFAFGAFIYALVAYNTHNLGQGWLEYNAHVYFYFQILYIAVVIAIFACFFIGTDYSDGTIRNKLIVGHSREEIYVSFLFTVGFAAVLFVAAHLLAVILIGLPFSGTAVLTYVHAQPWRLINCGLIIAEYTALFSMLSMLDSNKARNVVISLLVAAVTILSGMMVYGRLSEPEFVIRVVPQPDGSILLEEGLPNSQYLTGTFRIVFEWITALIPSGSVMLSLDKNFGFDWRNPVCAVIVIALLISVGIGIFKKKDIK